MKDKIPDQGFGLEGKLPKSYGIVGELGPAGLNIGLRVNVEFTDSIQMDMEKIQHAFMNIVYNACDAMPDGGSFTIRSRLFDDDIVLFEFIDSGCGMSPEMRKRIFKPFATEGKALGTGLGDDDCQRDLR